MATTNQKYDIAISFCFEDEDLALSLRDALDGLNVFVYSKAQEVLAGTDGMQAFIDTFRSNARTIVVLHRDKWGTTKWTRVEENAIKDYCLDGNWDGLFFVRTPESTQLPKWVPTTHLYFDVSEFPFDQLVGAIKARAKERGSTINPETVAEKGRRMAARHAYDEETRALMRSQEGVKQAEAAVSEMLASMSVEVDSIKEAGIDIQCEGSSSGYFVVRSNGVSLIMNWQHYTNDITDRPLMFRIFRGVILLPSEKGKFWAPGEPEQRQEFSLIVDRAQAYGWCMRERPDSRALSPVEAAQYVLERFLDAYDRLKDEPLQ